MSEQILDSEALNNLRALDPEGGDAFLREVAGIFLEDTPKRLGELEQSLAAGDAPTFIRAAHSIKGASANLGAALLRAAAEQLEHRAKKEGLANVSALVAEVKTQFDRARTALNELLPPA
ncbi:MAG TPA: Hpt domain-containing protein [Opitutaceae bacterium]|nr:Hpt domain-containing protein [Opitutaceae bacterium]